MGDIVSSITKIFTKFISWFIPMPDIPDFGNSAANQAAQGVLVNKQSNNANIPVIYGTRLVGGTRVFLETSGADNQYLYGVLVLAEGEINDITSILFDDDTVTFSGSIADGSTITSNDSRFGTNIQVQPFFGTDGQSAASLLTGLSSWGSNHKLSGIAYIAFRLEWNQDKFGGVPKIQAVVEGKKVVAYNSSSVAQTAAFSSNPAWCLLDYLTNERYGKGIAIADIDIPSFYTASTVATTQVTPYSGADQINLFDCNAVLDTSKKILDNVKVLVKGMRGFLPYTQGKYKLIIETTGSAAITLTTDTIIGGMKVQSQRKNENFNRVSASFVNPLKNYQADTIVYPESDIDHQALKTADGGFLQEGTIDIPTITSPYQALEFAEIVLNRSRNNLAVDLTANYEALDLAIGDIVNVTHPITGFSAKPFRVNGISLNSNFTVGLSLTEHQDSWYSFTAKTVVANIPDTTFPNPYSVTAPASLTLTDTLVEYNDGTVIVALDIAIGASTDKFVDYYQVEYKLSTDSDYIVYAQGSGLNHRVLNVIDQQTYDVRVKSVNSLGINSTYTSAQRTIVGAIEPPSDVEDFSCNIVGQEAHLSWSQISDLDLAYYNLRFSEEIDGTADWQNSVSLVEKVSRPATSITVPARQGTYLLKAVDKLGNFSSNATAIISNVTSITGFNNIQTQAEHPLFAGTLTNTVVADNTLRLDSSELFDSASGDFDTETTRFFDSGVANADFYATGNYLFADVIDIGAKHTVRLTATLKQTSDNPDDLFDNRTGLFDVSSSNFDGDTPANANSHLEISTSDDNSTFTAFQNFVIGDYTARYFKFRVVLISRDLASTPVVEEVSIKIDMQDRLFSGNDITSGAATKTVTFTNPFKTTNYAIGITAQGMATGDYFLLESKTINGFNVTFKNSSNTAISKSFDYIAKGY
jgi:hypothetical protein